MREKWTAEQESLKAQLLEEDQLDLDPHNLEGTLQLIGAVDIGYSKNDDKKAVAVIIVMKYPSFEIVYEDHHHEIQVDYPYIPGFLAFKEIPVYQVLFDRFPKEFIPQVILVDGNGILHTRQFGCASHIGVKFNIPTIGVAKKTFDVDGLHKGRVKDICEEDLHEAGDIAYLKGDSGKVWGAALRCTNESKNPIFISVGHRVSLETSIKIVKMSISKFRIPEPIRQADLRGRKIVKKIYDS